MPDGQVLERADTVRLGPFLVAADGSLRPAPGAEPRFSLRWRGCTVHARIEAAGDLVLEAMAGRVPSTASCKTNPAARLRAFDLARRLPAHLPRGWQRRLRPDHGITVCARRRLTMPMLAGDLIAAVTEFLLELAPYLEVMAAAGAAPAAGAAVAAAAAGKANT